MPEIEVPVLTIFSQPSCVQCTAAERRAIAKKIPYQKIDVTETPEALKLIKDDWGYLRAPVLYYNGEHRSGFDPDFIDSVEKELVAA